MPVGAVSEPVRFVIDESSLDFRGLSDRELDRCIDLLVQTLEELRSDSVVAKFSLIYFTECDNGIELWDFLSRRDAATVSPDTRRLLSILLDRCPSWDDESIDSPPTEVRVDDELVDPAWSVGYALRGAASGHYIGCVVFASRRLGWLPATGDGHDTDIYFVAAPEQQREFWQGLFSREDIKEPEFLDHASRAFPSLVCAPSLRFRSFHGTYRELRDWVVHVLAVIDAHFAEAIASSNGQTHQVIAHLGAKGVNASPESPKTRGNQKAMAQREVAYADEIYRCEWHAKKEGHRDRIHFSLPDPRLDGRVLVGIFTEHLNT